MKDSSYIVNNNFVFPHDKLSERVFGHVAEYIMKVIEVTKDKFSKGIGGIFLSGTIGEESYLKKKLEDRLRTSNLNVYYIVSTFVISEGLVSYGLRDRKLAVPYLIEKTSERQESVGQLENSASYVQKWKTTKFKDVDYIIGLGKTHRFYIQFGF
jgi:hypothetical protein